MTLWTSDFENPDQQHLMVYGQQYSNLININGDEWYHNVCHLVILKYQQSQYLQFLTYDLLVLNTNIGNGVKIQPAGHGFPEVCNTRLASSV